jgi:hypothetical protein
MSGYVFDGSTVDRRGFLRLLGAGVSIPVIAGLTGCGGGGSGALGGGNKGGKVTELIVPTNRSPWLPAYREVAAQYEKESGVKVTLREFPYDGLRTQMANAIQNKSAAFDLFQLDEPWTGQFYDNNWVAPLADIDPAFKARPTGPRLRRPRLLGPHQTHVGNQRQGDGPADQRQRGPVRLPQGPLPAAGPVGADHVGAGGG